MLSPSQQRTICLQIDNLQSNASLGAISKNAVLNKVVKLRAKVNKCKKDIPIATYQNWMLQLDEIEHFAKTCMTNRRR